jgi:diphosphomevalonate decarboxylase
VKYWGKRNKALNLPAVSSVSMTISKLFTSTTVCWGSDEDAVRIDDRPAGPAEKLRVLNFLDLFSSERPPCEVHSNNNFPTAAGLASSSSAFAALALAAGEASGLGSDATTLSRLARQGSGSACRSMWGGFVHWPRGEHTDGSDSHGHPIASQDHWDLSLVIAVVSSTKKSVGSTHGMERSRLTSPYFSSWLQRAEEDVKAARQAILARDLPSLGRVMESSTFKMHATMHTADPPLMYWQPATVACLQEVFRLREAGVLAWSTMDAGPNVKVICKPEHAEAVQIALATHVEQVFVVGVGDDPRLVQ